MFFVTGPLTVSTSAWRGEATKRKPKRSSQTCAFDASVETTVAAGDAYGFSVDASTFGLARLRRATTLRNSTPAEKAIAT